MTRQREHVQERLIGAPAPNAGSPAESSQPEPLRILAERAGQLGRLGSPAQFLHLLSVMGRLAVDGVLKPLEKALEVIHPPLERRDARLGVGPGRGFVGLIRGAAALLDDSIQQAR